MEILYYSDWFCHGSARNLYRVWCLPHIHKTILTHYVYIHYNVYISRYNIYAYACRYIIKRYYTFCLREKLITIKCVSKFNATPSKIYPWCKIYILYMRVYRSIIYSIQYTLAAHRARENKYYIDNGICGCGDGDDDASETL